MFRVVIPALLAVALTACGGGGGGSSPTNNATVDGLQVAATYSARYAPMVLGKFKDSQTQYLVQAHYKFLGDGQTGPVPVKLYQLNSNGTMTDATTEILGGAVTVSTNYPLIADFNHDGIDDLFLPGFSDSDKLLPSVAFISRPGMSHIRVDLPDRVWAHGATVVDANNDGNLDVMSNWGEVWFNDGHGNFTFRSHSYNDVPGMWIHGSGICAGDFNNTGRAQVVLTDQMVDPNKGPIADTVIFEIGATGLPVAQYYLPTPVLDRTSTTSELSHDVACRVADLNNDGKLDILVFSRPWASTGSSWTNEGTVQVLINRGNWQFDDVTDLALSMYNKSALVSYTAMILDLNGDGKLDIWTGYFDFGTGKANQAFLNNGSGLFATTNKTVIDSFNASGGMLPVKFGDKWAFVFSTMNSTTSDLYITKPLYTFN